MAENNFGGYDKFSLAATVRSRALPVPAGGNVGYALRTTGTAAGTWRVQYSNDYIEGTDDPTADDKWDEYTLTTNPPDAAGSAQKFGVILDDYEYRWVRIKFTRSSGSGTAEVWAQVT